MNIACWQLDTVSDELKNALVQMDTIYNGCEKKEAST